MGGEHSGHYGHAGRPGDVGGSAPSSRISLGDVHGYMRDIQDGEYRGGNKSHIARIKREFIPRGKPRGLGKVIVDNPKTYYELEGFDDAINAIINRDIPKTSAGLGWAAAHLAMPGSTVRRPAHWPTKIVQEARASYWIAMYSRVANLDTIGPLGWDELLAKASG